MRWVRTALYEAANVLLSHFTRFSKLKRWGMDVAKRRGSKRAKVALARKLPVIMHRIWVDGTEVRWTREIVAAHVRSTRIGGNARSTQVERYPSRDDR